MLLWCEEMSSNAGVEARRLSALHWRIRAASTQKNLWREALRVLRGRTFDAAPRSTHPTPDADSMDKKQHGATRLSRNCLNSI